MTDDEIKAVVCKYIVDCFESDNADCLHEMDEWYDESSLEKGYEYFRKANVTVTFDE